jgi:hypothetical protein
MFDLNPIRRKHGGSILDPLEIHCPEWVSWSTMINIVIVYFAFAASVLPFKKRTSESTTIETITNNNLLFILHPPYTNDFLLIPVD